jgi:hypothetical protein
MDLKDMNNDGRNDVNQVKEGAEHAWDKTKEKAHELGHAVEEGVDRMTDDDDTNKNDDPDTDDKTDAA